MSDENTHDVDIALMRAEMASLRTEVKKLTSDVEGLVDAWRTASGVVAFVKWVAGFIAALGVIWAAVKLKIGA